MLNTYTLINLFKGFKVHGSYSQSPLFKRRRASTLLSVKSSSAQLESQFRKPISALMPRGCYCCKNISSACQVYWISMPVWLTGLNICSFFPQLICSAQAITELNSEKKKKKLCWTDLHYVPQFHRSCNWIHFMAWLTDWVNVSVLPLIIIGSCVCSCIGQNDLCLTDCSALKKVTYGNWVADSNSEAQWFSTLSFFSCIQIHCFPLFLFFEFS